MSTKQTVPTVIVFDYLYDEAGNALVKAAVEVILNYSQATLASPQVILENVKQTTTTDSNGYWQVTIARNTDISPLNTVYDVKTPFRSFQISVPAGAGPFQATTYLANAVSTLSPASTGLTGPITVTGNETVTGNLTVQGTTALQTGATVTGGESLAGGLTLTDNASQIIPGATSMSLRNHANSADNVLVTDAGAATVRNGLTVAAGGETITAGGLTVVAGGITDTGNVSVGGSLTTTGGSGTGTFSGAVTVQSGGLTVTSGGVTVTGGGLTVSAGAVAVPDTSFLFRKLQLENNVTRVGPAIQNPAGITPGAGNWGNWGTAYTVTPAVASDLMIFVSANISSTAISAFLMQVLVDGAITALNPLAGADVTVGGKTQCVSLIDYVHNATAAAHTIQVQLKPIAASTLASGATGLNLFTLAIPST